MIAFEARTQLAVPAADLAIFEQQYGMRSAEFARRYEAGQADDCMDFVAWASLVRMCDNLQQRLPLDPWREFLLQQTAVPARASTPAFASSAPADG